VEAKNGVPGHRRARRCEYRLYFIEPSNGSQVANPESSAAWQ
jgi:hypothetical protein